MVLEKSPVSPSIWPVAMPEAFAVVKVGNRAWLLRRLTPSRAIAAMVGAVESSTMRKRRPSATNRTTLCGCGTGAWAKAADASVADSTVVPIMSSGRMGQLRALTESHVLERSYDMGVTAATAAYPIRILGQRLRRLARVSQPAFRVWANKAWANKKGGPLQQSGSRQRSA